jgi:hypothetical protein
MTTYICKCGRTFQKNTEAGTTGFRMPDYGPEHECFGCPFVCKVMTWDPGTQQNAVQNHECRGSKELQYETQAALSLGDKCVGRIYGLDLDFLHQVRAFADSLDSIDPDRYAFSDRPADYGDDGRFKLTIYPAQNNKGIAAKQTLFEEFFNPDGSRKDVTPGQEKEIVLNQIKEAKALAQGKTTPAWTAYVHGNFRYFVDQRDDNGKFTAFMSSSTLGDGVRSEVPTVPDFETFDEAQNALDGFAMKKGYAAEDFTPNETLEGEDDQGQSGLSTDESPEPPEDSGDSENNTQDQPQEPCGWKNASGADDEDDGEPDEEPEVSGDPLSLRGNEFDEIMCTADSVLNRLVAMLHAKKQRDGEMTIKVTFEDADGDGSYIFGGAVSGKINYTVKPQKISSEPVELKFDAQGNPIVPADRQHQLNFDELQPGRNIPPSGTATVDGNTGIVEGYHEDQGEQAEEKLYHCTNVDCPFYGIPDVGDAGCCYDPGAEDAHDPDVVRDLGDAIRFQSCTRPEVIAAYAADHPVEETDFEGSGDDFPPFPDDEREDKVS